MKPQPIFALLFISFLFAGPDSSAQDTRAFNQNASRSNHTRLRFTGDNTFILQASGGLVKALQDNAEGHFTPAVTAGYFKGKIGATLEGGHFPTDQGFDLKSYTAGIKSFTTTDLHSSKGAWYLAIGAVYRQPLPGDLQLQAGIAGGVRKNSFGEFAVTDISSGEMIADYNHSQQEDLRQKPLQLLIKPTIRLEWFPANSFIGVHLYASSLVCPSEQSVTVRFKDLLRVKYDGSQQEIRAQVMNAPFLTERISTAKTTMSVGGGISLRLKTRHDTVKNSINNVR
ncbi:hypothetical protein JMG10_22340 [Nostoc ellipsosporum NOK]|nr:hypothetical protein [Nostoc ellipsosporum NOK]